MYPMTESLVDRSAKFFSLAEGDFNQEGMALRATKEPGEHGHERA